MAAVSFWADIGPSIAYCRRRSLAFRQRRKIARPTSFMSEKLLLDFHGLHVGAHFLDVDPDGFALSYRTLFGQVIVGFQGSIKGGATCMALYLPRLPADRAASEAVS